MQFRSRSGKSILVILIVAAVVAIAGGVGVGMFLTRRAQASPNDKKEQAKPNHEASHGPIQTVHSLGEIVVCLADQGDLRYAKMSVAIGFEEKLPEAKLKEAEPILKDAVIGVLTAKHFKDVHRKNGLPKLKKELLAACAARLTEATVAEIYIEAFAMQ